MKKILLLFSMLAAFVAALAQDEESKQKLQGYAQVRYTTDLSGINAVELRRLKFKLTSTPAFSQHFSYYLKVEVSSRRETRFSLLDLRLGYQLGNFTVYAGQFLPDFSLQRFQSDYVIPTVERSMVIDNLLPAGNLGARDLGVQLAYDSENKFLHSTLGVFNGRGVKYWTRDNKGFLLVHKTDLRLANKGNLKLRSGYSLAYRRTEDLPMPGILPDSVLFSGQDFRFNLYSRIELPHFSVQGEWIKGFLNNQVMQGYYILSDVTFGKHQISFSTDKFSDLIPDTSDKPWFYLGYNYLIDGYWTKISTAFRFQYYDNTLKNPSLIIQFQIFMFR